MTAANEPAEDDATPKPGEPQAANGAESSQNSAGDGGFDLAKNLEERTKDLQRVTAEYHNYRKRVDRDRAAAAEQVTANVVAGLLPVLDDIDRADEHGDLVGPFRSVSETLKASLTKLGLEVFGEKGDPFDPAVHEAVAHMHSAEVTETSCIDVMRRGYRLGDRLLRAAMVAVAEPEEGASTVVEVDANAEPIHGSVAEDTAPAEDAEVDELAESNLDVDVPEDEEALKAETVEAAVDTASTTDAAVDTESVAGDFHQERPASEKPPQEFEPNNKKTNRNE